MENSVTALLIFVLAIVATLLGLLSRIQARSAYKDRLSVVREEWLDLALSDASTLRIDDDIYLEFDLFVRFLGGAYADKFTVLTIVRTNLQWRGQKSQKSGASQTWDSRINQIEDAETREKALAIWRRIPWLMHNYLCARSFSYLLWTTVKTVLQQPIQDHRERLYVNEAPNTFKDDEAHFGRAGVV